MCSRCSIEKGADDAYSSPGLPMASGWLGSVHTGYLLVVDYFPGFKKLTSSSSASIIATLKAMFARYRTPEILGSNNGPQYSSEEFQRFAEIYGIQHLTGSPRYPQSNGQAKRTVRTVKRLLRKSEDPFLFWNGVTG